MLTVAAVLMRRESVFQEFGKCQRSEWGACAFEVLACQ